MREPNPIKFILRGNTAWLSPFHLDLKELYKLRDWINRVIEWKIKNAEKL